MPCSTPSTTLTKPTQTAQTRRHDKIADVTQHHYTSLYFPHTCKMEHLYPPTSHHHRHQPLPGGGLCGRGLFGMTLSPPRHVPPPIKETRIKAKDSIDIFRRRIRQNGNNYQYNTTCKTELARNKENVDSNQSITDEYLKVFEDEQNDEAEEDTIRSNRPFRALPYPIQPKSSLLGPSQGLERYKAVYDENKVMIPLTGSPEEWEWDRLLEEMENNDNKKR
ncbi:hypothetical protein I315_03361 [Cryptococcus gattii Ru294]|nr:hypothetical protein I315_03361 [Cryptococcus gattii Ru294]